MSDGKDKLIAKPLSGSGNEDEVEPAGLFVPRGERKNYLICIGVGKYKNGKIKNLSPYCENDCTDLTELLIADYSFETVKGVYKKGGERISDEEQVLLNENATLDNIRALFDNLSYHPDFITKAGANTVQHNLLIFYSGHGAIITDNEGVDTFYWVPTDYENDGDAKSLVDVFALLENFRRFTRFHSFVLVTDACHSAGTFNLANRVATQRNSKPGARAEEERSAWALCSSADNQESFAVPDDRNSWFTKHLLTELHKSGEMKLRISTLCDRLDESFDASIMRPFNGRLDLVANNTGVFCFNGSTNKRAKIDVCKRKERLQNDVYRLNYEPQRKVAEEMNPEGMPLLNGKRYLICLSGCPEYGLKMAHHHIANSAFFPIPYSVQRKVPFLLSVQDTQKSVETFIVETLSSQLDIALTGDKAVLNKQLQQKLAVAPVIVEMRIDPQTIAPAFKKTFIKEFYNLLSSLELPDDANSFCVFLIDSDGTDYRDLTRDYSGNVELYVVPKIEDITQPVFLRWYSEVRGVDRTQWAMFDELFSGVITAVRQEYLATGTYPPGKFIHALCEKSDCPELTLNILNF